MPKAPKKLKPRIQYIFFDTETTGLVGNPLVPAERQPRIIEFYGAITDDEGGKIQELDFLCHPQCRITPEITEITGITNEMVRNEKPFSAYAPRVASMLNPKGELMAVVGHNLAFDYEMIEIEWKLCKYKQPLAWPPIKICTVNQTEHLLGHRLKLGDLYEHLFDKRFAGAHRAKQDVEALIECFFELKRRGEL